MHEQAQPVLHTKHPVKRIAHMNTCIARRCCYQHHGSHPSWLLLLQAPKLKRKYKRRKYPAEVSAKCRAAAHTRVEHEGQMVPAYMKGGEAEHVELA
jgi:hypothetical protein